MKQYSKQFRDEAVALADDIGPGQAAKNLGVNYYTLAGWRKNRKSKEAAIAKYEAEPEANLTREKQMEKKIAELQRTVEILSDAVSFFVDRQKK